MYNEIVNDSEAEIKFLLFVWMNIQMEKNCFTLVENIDFLQSNQNHFSSCIQRRRRGNPSRRSYGMPYLIVQQHTPS